MNFLSVLDLICCRSSFRTELDDEIVKRNSKLVIDQEHFVITLATLHDQLCDSISTINSTFSLQIAANVGAVLFFNIFNLFGIYRILIGKSTTDDLNFMAYNTILNVFYTSFLILYIACSSLLTREVDYFNCFSCSLAVF